MIKVTNLSYIFTVHSKRQDSVNIR